MQAVAAGSLVVIMAMSASARAAPCADPVACARACSARDTAACIKAAEAYFDGNNVPLDAARSLALAKTACDAGDPEGCSLLGCHYQDGVGGAWQPALAVATYEKACRDGSGLGCFNLAGMYAGGHGVVVDDDKYRAYRKLAKQRWQAACDGTATRWCTPLAGMVDDDGEPEVAMKLLARACDHGDRNACVESAKRGLMKGTVKPDAALGEATRQCQAGNGHGCGVAGAMLVLGEHGVARDARRGFELEKRACALGEKTSCAGAGSAYATGEVVAKDDKLARRHFEMACDRRLARACLAIAQDAVSQHDTRRAVEFGRRACQMNNGEACELVATAQLAAGNDADGIRWATEACRMGRGTVCGVLVERDLELPVPPHIKPQLYSEGCKAGLPAACKHVAK